ncbi:hypothetical protein [Methanospirillum sp.]
MNIEFTTLSFKPDKAVHIVNTYSRKGVRLFLKALDLLHSKGINVVTSCPVRKPEQLQITVENLTQTPIQVTVDPQAVRAIATNPSVPGFCL